MGFLPATTWSIKETRGFTLMELIIAMTIVAVISGALLANFFTSLSKGRDAKRKQDLESVTKALELYYNDNRAYPTGFPSPGTSLSNSAGNVVYMQKVPTDAKTGYTYKYSVPADGSTYALYACLENSNDSAYKDYGSGITCGTCGNCKYGISSSNTTP